MQIGLAGLVVRAPRWVPLREIEAALLARADWILGALRRWRGRRRDVLPRDWKTGAPILYRGARSRSTSIRRGSGPSRRTSST